MIVLRHLDAGDLAALREIQHAHHELPWSEDELRAQLYDHGRAHGAQVVIAVDDGAVVGCAGWVEAAPWLFGAPVLARHEAAAVALVAHLVARAGAIGAARLRISATPREHGKRAALEAAGFAPALDFVTVARAVGAADGRAWDDARVPHDALDAARLADLTNDTFDGIPNTTRTTAAEVREELDAPRTSRAATAAWLGADGAYVAFAQVTEDDAPAGRFATVDAIGVRAAARRGGVAGRVLDDVLARVRGRCGEVRALIASTNAASLGLFAARGFAERARRTVYERPTPA